jgi:hypothetical protein
MKKRLFKYLLITASVVLLSVGCSKDSLLDLVLGSQPNFEKGQNFVPGINIFGVIRPDSAGSQPMSVIKVEKVIPSISETTDSTTLLSLDASVFKISNNKIVDSLSFRIRYPDTTFIHQPADFGPLPGNHFRIICKSPGLPVLTAETIIPAQPSILENSVIAENNKVKFTIIEDRTAFLYDVVLYIGSKKYSQRELRAMEGNTEVEFAVENINNSLRRIVIYGYDKNLSEYLTAQNLFIKPNTYRPPFSSVQNGYGVFGSLNIFSKNF